MIYRLGLAKIFLGNDKINDYNNIAAMKSHSLNILGRVVRTKL